VALILEDAPHEYANCSPLIELALDEDECLCSPCDASSLRMIGGQPSLDKPLQDRESPVGVFKIQLGQLIDHHDFKLLNLWRLLPLCSHRGRVLVTREDPVWYRLAT
jgi:hypothetical protein